jgi:hypothetical protein
MLGQLLLESALRAEQPRSDQRRAHQHTSGETPEDRSDSSQPRPHHCPDSWPEAALPLR